ncbi:hypothetical protein HQ563_18210, partial [bacterium]|nr:hypothetical protein [bacterium]
ARSVEGGVELSWTMRPQTSYSVLSSPHMSTQPWTEETTILGGKSGGPSAWIDVDRTSTLKFYRIGIE